MAKKDKTRPKNCEKLQKFNEKNEQVKNTTNREKKARKQAGKLQTFHFNEEKCREIKKKNPT